MFDTIARFYIQMRRSSSNTATRLFVATSGAVRA